MIERSVFIQKLRKAFPTLDEELSQEEIDQSFMLTAEIQSFGQRLQGIFPDVDTKSPEEKFDRIFEIATRIHSEMGSGANFIEALSEARRRAATRGKVTLDHTKMLWCILNHVFKNAFFPDGPVSEKGLPSCLERFTDELKEILVGLSYYWGAAMLKEQHHDGEPCSNWFERYDIEYSTDGPQPHTFFPTETHVDIKEGMTRESAARQVAHIIANLSDVDCPYVNVTLACDYDSDADTLELTTTCSVKPGREFAPIPPCQESCLRRRSVSAEAPQASPSESKEADKASPESSAFDGKSS